MYRTDWFRFQIKVRNNQLLQLDPVNISARRVHVLHNKNGTGITPRELVRDVVLDANKKDNVEDVAAPAISEKERKALRGAPEQALHFLGVP
jgi:hypothetical protein